MRRRLFSLALVLLMAVAFDVTSESHTATTGSASQASFSWSHAGAASGVKGVIVFTFVNANANDATSVTYGGVPLTAVSGGRAVDTATEPGDCKAWFLGAGVPQGTQTVLVNRTNNANVMYAVATTVTAAKDTEVYAGDIVLLQTDGTLAVQSITDGSPGTDSVRFAGVNSGLSAVPAAGTGSTVMHGIDFGTRVIQTVRETTAGQGERNVGFSSGTSDDRAAVHLAVRELVPDVGYSTSTTGSLASGTSLTFTHHTSAAGANRALLVWVHTFKAGGADTPTATYGGTSLTQAATAAIDGDRITLLRLVAPATGNNSVVVSTATANEIIAIAATFVGVDQTTPLGTPGTNVVNSVTSSSINISSGTTELVADGLGWFNQSGIVVGALQTRHNTINEGDGVLSALAVSTEWGAATTTMSWSWPASEDPRHAAVAIKPVSGAPTATRGQVGFAEFEAPFMLTRGQVSFAELEVPLVPTRGLVSFAEFEVPLVASRGQVSFAEFEAPSLPTPARGQVSFTEFEIPSLAATRGQVSLVEFEVPVALTRGQVSFGEFEIPNLAARGLLSFAELEVPELSGLSRSSYCGFQSTICS